MAKKLWGGRFTGATDPLMTAFNASLSFDSRMAQADLAGSKAYAKALSLASLLTSQELSSMLSGLELVSKEWTDGVFVCGEADEDIHSANERRLGELIGSLAGKLHTGRSRNDQVVTDMRLWLRDECAHLLRFLKAFIRVAVDRAEQEMEVVMPGYTHLQRAMPIRWSHWVLSHVWSFKQDAERLTQLMVRVNQLPLGSGALAGTLQYNIGNPFNIDREFLKTELGFDGIMPNSLYNVSDRDFVAEFLCWSSLTMVHLSRWSEDLIIYSTAEFGFVKLADAYSTGSSLMPQKKNPDSLELIRGIPSTYNKDLQEDKEPLFDAVDTLAGCIQISTGVLSTLTINPIKMKAALSIEMLATDLAEYLVRKGVPFRETHHISGHAVRMAEERGVGMDQLTLEDFKSLHFAFEADVAQVWDFERSIEQRSSVGGTSKSSVLFQIKQLREFLSQ